MFHLIPVNRHKVPLTRHGEKDASADLADWAHWKRVFPGCNFAIATGPSGLIAVDRDTYKAAYKPPPELDDLPVTVCWRTARGGYVSIYRRPSGLDVPSKNGIAPAVDVKCSTGYVLIPPSVNAEGQPYTWVNAPDEFEIASAPQALVDWIFRESGKSKNVAGKPKRQGKSGDEVYLGAGTGRWDACLRIGGLLREEGCGEAVIYDALTSFVRHQCERDDTLRDEEMLRIARWLAEKPIGVAVKLEELMAENEEPKIVKKDGVWRKK